MSIDWAHLGPTLLAAFLASTVEFVEALTVILAVGTVRGWRGALSGAGLALAVLLALRRLGRVGGGWDGIAVAAAFKITMLEGIEVVFIVIAMGAGGPGLLVPAGAGALAALLAVAALGLLVHRPLTRIPENALKFAVGVLLSAFGAFWFGEGSGIAWPGEDWSILALVLGFLAAALAAVPLCRPARAPGDVR